MSQRITKLDTTKETAVIELHNIARFVESNIGVGKLSEDIRNCADRLHALTKKISSEESTSKENTSEESDS